MYIKSDGTIIIELPTTDRDVTVFQHSLIDVVQAAAGSEFDCQTCNIYHTLEILRATLPTYDQRHGYFHQPGNPNNNNQNGV